MKNFLFCFVFISIGFASGGFVNDPDEIVLDKAEEKIQEMALEIYNKTGIVSRLDIIKKLPAKQTITQYGKQNAQDINSSSFVLVSFSQDDMQVDLITSSDLKDVIDKDEILDDYIITILVAQNKKKTDQQKYSAALLNGMAEVADRLASYKKITLESSIGSESKNFYDGLMVIIKIMVLLTILAFGYSWFKGKKNA